MNIYANTKVQCLLERSVKMNKKELVLTNRLNIKKKLE